MTVDVHHPTEGDLASPSLFWRVRDHLGTITEEGSDNEETLLRAGGALADHLADPHAIARFLGGWMSVLQSGEHAETLDRGRSHLHANGFSKISMMRLGAAEKWNLRLHIWWGTAKDSWIHDHRWSFSSMVLTGRMEAWNFRPMTDEATDAGQRRIRLYDADASGAKRVQELPACPLRTIAHYTLRTGDTHFLHFDEPHLVANPVDSPLATLMLSAPPARSFSHRYGEIQSGSLQQGNLAPTRTLDAGDCIRESRLLQTRVVNGEREGLER
ncbi:hypothetical protein ETD86_17750 [Nonomuraea turkmeniaca]|uniref:Cysteine dioxygenase n=1 Tax=Nonomuraea turkmeniaca TaxID=103838 RepID=A0A5S4G443_9ACTN|nr:hypothetical protein [Nonomuraea turkmeniaca]TMR20730.1 hypothetical protein ETD86_17750 [Nonomuraea turkmeniaca]